MEAATSVKEIAIDSGECTVLIADTPELLEEVFHLRYQVYCLERGFEPGSGGKESDEYDSRARHVLLIHRASGNAIGTVRVIPPSPTIGLLGLPMTRVTAPGLMRHLPSRTTGEISRFTLSKQLRMGCHASSMVRLALMQGIVRLSAEMGLTDWCAIMEPTLLRLLRANAIYFPPLGPLVEYHGFRQPSYGNIATVLDQIQSKQPGFWNYLTLGGTLCRRRHQDFLAA